MRVASYLLFYALALMAADATAQLIWGVYNVVEVPGRVVGVDGAVVDYVEYREGYTVMGLLPVERSVDLLLEGGAKRTLNVDDSAEVYVDVCYVNYTRAELVSSLDLSVTVYLNGTRADSMDVGPGRGLVMVPVHSSGSYNLTLVIEANNRTYTVYGYAGAVKIYVDPYPATYGDIVVLSSDVAIATANSSGREVRIDTLALGAGNHTVALATSICNATLELQVRRAKGRLEVAGPRSVKFGRPIKMDISLILEGGRRVRRDVSVLVNGTEQRAPGGTFTFVPPSVGTYNITVIFRGDRDIAPARTLRVIRVAPLPVNMTGVAYDLDVEYGKRINISVAFDTYVEGVLDVMLLNRTYTFTVKGNRVEASIDTMEHRAGHHTIVVTLRPNSRNLAGTTFIGTLNILRTRPRLIIDARGVPVYGQDLEIAVLLTTSNGRPMPNRTIIIDTGLTRISLYTGRDGGARYTFRPPSAGLNVVWAVFPGDDTSLPVENKSIIMVERATPRLIVRVEGNRTYGNTLDVNIVVRPRIKGIALFFVNGTYTGSAEVGDGSAVVRWAPSKAGLFNVSVKFASRDPNYRDVAGSVLVPVAKARCFVEISAPRSARVLDAVPVRVSFQAGSPTLYVNGSRIALEGGRAVLRPLRPGTYNITAFWPGDERYEPCSDTYLLHVEKAAPKVDVYTSVRRAATGAPITIRVEVSSPLGTPVSGPVSLSLIHEKWGVLFTRTVYPVNGAAVFRIAVNHSGIYTVAARFEGDAVHAGASNSSVKIAVDPGLFGMPAVVLASIIAGILVGTLASLLYRGPKTFKLARQGNQ